MAKVAPIPLFRYTITLTDGTARECNAMQYGVEGVWLVFDAPDGTVLALRADLVQEVHRSHEPIAHQETDQL